eukprot:Nitzschia sp. Nitz4//scaffold238_size30058//14787//16766//NITZ4_008001-RA/size30058-processed-gene-0.62-mRNA-1//-1//CDS//3329543534//5383//frame0
MPFVKCRSSQKPHYDALACVLSVNEKPFGIMVLSESAAELLEFNTQRWWPIPMIDEENTEATKTQNNPVGCALGTVGMSAFVVGGMEGPLESSSRCFTFEFGSNSWASIPSMLEARTYPACLGLPALESLFVFGGRDVSFWKQLTSVECFSVSTRTWTPRAPLSIPRMAPAVVPLTPTLVAVIGGYVGDGWSTSVEIYDAERDLWDSSESADGHSFPVIPHMPCIVTFPKAVIIASSENEETGVTTTDRFFIVGSSKTSTKHTAYTMILSYNVETATWTKIVHNPVKRRILVPTEGCAVVAHEKKLYSIGGRSPHSLHPNSQARRGSASAGPSASRGASGGKPTKEVMEWSVALDDHSLVQDIMLSSEKSPRRKVSKQTVSSGKPLSSIRLDDDDDGSELASTSGTLMTSGASVGSQLPSNARGNRKGSIDLTQQNQQIPEGDEAEEKSSEFALEPPAHTIPANSPIEFRDSRGMAGKYSGQVDSTDGATPHGTGKFIEIMTGDCYEGEWRSGKRHGQGRLKYAGGDVFEGWFQDDMKQGKGTYQWRDGKQYDGKYVDDLAEDLRGSMTWKNGTVYIGQFTKGQRTGRGDIRFPDNVHFIGNFRNGKYDGFGTCTFADGKVYRGQWKKGKAHGMGKLMESDGHVLHDGEWANDMPVGAS